jgi:dipeptidyl aminopeptidase/acylaminoacyl peptidase
MKIFKTVFFLLFSFQIFAQSDLIKVTDLTKIKNVTAIVSSKDGKKVIYTLKTIEEVADKPFEYEYVNNLFLVDVANPSQVIPLTSGKLGASQAVFSPDGSKVAFVRTVNEKPQIFFLPLNGGEAWQLSKCPYGAGSPIFNTNGSKIYFTASLNGADIEKDSIVNQGQMWPKFSLEKPGMSNSEMQIAKTTKANPDGTLAEIRAYLDKNVDDKKAKVINRLNFQGEATVEPEIKYTHIFEIETKPNAKEKAITHGFSIFGDIRFVDASQKIMAIHADETIHPDRLLKNTIIELDPATQIYKTIFDKKDHSFSDFEVSPDGKYLATTMRNIANGLNYAQLILANIASGEIKTLPFERIPNNINWHSDNKTLFFTASANGATPLYTTNINTLVSTKKSDDNTAIGAFTLLEKGQIMYAFNNINTPNEIAISDENLKTPKTISAINTEWLANKKLSLPTKGVYKNNAGQNIDYWIMKPTNMVSGKKYPLLLQLHGGPTAMWGPSEPSMWHEFQYLCAQGYGIVYLNQRGSGGYGKDFQFSNYRDWGAGPASDALGSFDLAAKETWVDTSKNVITGGSYAGYLVAWIIAHDHRFKAAFAQRGVYDLTTFMGEGNAWRLVPNYFGLPWQPESETKINQNSPYSWVQNIRTPLLIKHGENDLRTGPIQSEMMYKSLKILGKDVEYVRLPGATHELSRTGNVRQRVDRILRINEFFKRYVSEK